MTVRSNGASLVRVAPLIALLLSLSAQAFAAKGAVTHKQGSCDYFVVETAGGYDLLEWYGGHDPDKGDVLVGDYESYGMRDIYDVTADDELRVWVEDYGLSKEDALEKMIEQCE